MNGDANVGLYQKIFEGGRFCGRKRCEPQYCISNIVSMMPTSFNSRREMSSSDESNYKSTLLTTQNHFGSFSPPQVEYLLLSGQVQDGNFRLQVSGIV